MTPPIATSDTSDTSDTKPTAIAPQEPGLSASKAAPQALKFPSPPTFTDKHAERKHLKERLALSFRIFGKYSFDEGVAGHITVRDPLNPHHFWVNPFGLAFSLIKASDLILVDETGNVIDGGPNRLLNTAAFMIHSAIHRARPDVTAAAHSHSIHGRAYCALGKPLDIITQDACAFYNDHVVYEAFNGVVLAAEEGQNIATCLGDKKAALLQNHGLLTVGRTVEEAVFWFVSLEKCCQAQLMADAAAGGRGIETKKIESADAEFTHKAVGSALAGWFSAKPLFDVVHRETGGEYLG
ncbi:arad-like aldolase/epimerase [Saccharata proteae CBS 121410]|uniref:Arad-like aldolase/epimerase n=1 Tax=Saccharata proteae CBS 121410 TaxID=1314787 RepID=A0A9P4M212_9PEZI|nr:arad-like aldolase/epimerase [Saccharata proteae CBS 121410]